MTVGIGGKIGVSGDRRNIRDERFQRNLGKKRNITTMPSEKEEKWKVRECLSSHTYRTKPWKYMQIRKTIKSTDKLMDP